MVPHIFLSLKAIFFRAEICMTELTYVVGINLCDVAGYTKFSTNHLMKKAQIHCVSAYVNKSKQATRCKNRFYTLN